MFGHREALLLKCLLSFEKGGAKWQPTKSTYTLIDKRAILKVG